MVFGVPLPLPPDPEGVCEPEELPLELLVEEPLLLFGIEVPLLSLVVDDPLLLDTLVGVAADEGEVACVPLPADTDEVCELEEPPL